MAQLQRITILFFGVLFFGASVAYHADAFVYQVHFQYDKETDHLALDESKGVPVQVDSSRDLNPLEFFDENGLGSFSLRFLFDSGEEIARKDFTPSTNGPFVLDVPYLSFARSIAVYRSGVSMPILSYDLSKFLTCNKNGVCEYEKGENMNTCIPDCVGTTVNFSDETKKLLKQNNDVLRDPNSGEVVLRGIQASAVASTGGTAMANNGAGSILVIVGGIAVVLISVGVVVLIRLRARNKRYGL